ncbi:MAG: ABC transporter substrate-binding protein [Desulfamplus sp.]|nr:ABC transporter substrate-binding protein [Desulfamplus sp.]
MIEKISCSPHVAGFMVAEPIATKAIATEIGNLEFISATRWDKHPCCIVAMQKDFIDKYPDAVQEFVELLIDTGLYVEDDRVRAAEIAVKFLDPDGQLGLNTKVLEKVFSQPLAIKMDDLYPVIEDFDTIQKYMHDVMEIGRLIDLEKFINKTFADKFFNK